MRRDVYIAARGDDVRRDIDRGVQGVAAYRPLVVLLGLLAVLVAAYPSVQRDAATTAPQAEVPAPTASTGAHVSAGPTSGDARESAPSTGAGGDGIVDDSRTGGAEAARPGGRSVADARSAGDVSHCVNGRQFAGLGRTPPCRPRFSGDNGGATARGVTADKVRIVFFQLRTNEQVGSVLRSAGVADDNATLDAAFAAMTRFVNERWELYGRKIEFVRFASRCPQTPPDIPLCLEEARRAMTLKPFMVFEPSPLYPAIHDEWARSGVISVGGWHFERSYFTQRRPYRYDVLMDGSQAMEALSGFYCSQMAGKAASHAGRVIHPRIGGRTTPRRLAILTQDDDARARAARYFATLVDRCNGGEPAPLVVTYSTDIERAQESASGLTTKLIEAGVTTVVCSCDSVAPMFLLPAFTASNYFPEHLLAGTGLVDSDRTGRLFDPAQWAHAFGLGHLPDPQPAEDSDGFRAMRAGGAPNMSCATCGAYWAYFATFADMLQAAGPRLTPQTLEAGTLRLPPSTGPFGPLHTFGPDDYTAWSDVRVTYWDPSATSRYDGSGGGAYVTVKGRRVPVGSPFPAGVLARIPAAPS